MLDNLELKCPICNNLLIYNAKQVYVINDYHHYGCIVDEKDHKYSLLFNIKTGEILRESLNFKNEFLINHILKPNRDYCTTEISKIHHNGYNGMDYTKGNDYINVKKYLLDFSDIDFDILKKYYILL